MTRFLFLGEKEICPANQDSWRMLPALVCNEWNAFAVPDAVVGRTSSLLGCVTWERKWRKDVFLLLMCHCAWRNTVLRLKGGTFWLPDVSLVQRKVWERYVWMVGKISVRVEHLIVVYWCTESTTSLFSVPAISALNIEHPWTSQGSLIRKCPAPAPSD